ncbi:hypothetical protein F2Q70_00027175 [Brassica cretica]|uniref:Transposase MuDR plant domain-containing protein n=1 Tax=Brassica cretica TaxID=69181 RepID=A0A8S9LH04_BRACR|nr:hypothetical protein F2Q70_00027175 [Brassica cretica]
MDGANGCHWSLYVLHAEMDDLLWDMSSLSEKRIFLISDEDLVVKVKCYHSGKFEKKEAIVDYVDGEVTMFEVDYNCVFTSLVSKLTERNIVTGKVWFKLPYENIEDRKPLWENVEKNKKKLETAGRWYKEVDIYIEKDGIEARENGVHEEMAIEPIHEGGEHGSDDEVEDPTYGVEASDDDSVDFEAGLSENSESDDKVEVVEEEIDILEDVDYEEQIPDEDEVYPATDDSSGDEEEQAERLVKRNVLDGVFSLRQLFSTGEEFKENVIRYILKTRRNVVFDRWEKTKLGARCDEKDCGWRIYCSVENPIGKWMVKTYEDEHQCHPVGRCKQIKSPVIADLFLEDIRRDPEMSAPEIKDEMKRRYNIIISPPQSQVARRMIFDKLQAETNEQFARLRDYEHEIKSPFPPLLTLIHF